MSKGKNTRQFIIEQTAPLFNTKGVAATAITDIMEVTNLAKGSLYVHFANKEELAYCAVDYNLQQFVEKTGAEAQKYSGAKEKFFALLDYLGDPLNPPVKGGCPMMNFGMEADDTNPVIREKVYNTICTVQQAMTDIVEQGIAEGTFNKDWDVKVFVTKAYAMIEGGILVSRVSGNSDQMNLLVGLLKAEIAAQVIKS
ncbi:TetR/AcrR family transcriptional regulator [Chitinophaga pinensis]|uniref:Transcriptional regulator, TetR family n=1 Tax=Chitinophaga pinensis (strain ATCC 43595 / DSM 2588 / LMG 13176 / NBRC 15968 / NCIMB 11800 / UQM 2034) TaxID=485918 RepID=A0A979G6V1_CHIPD|nr:TetR/AcrR family transcriptional regulator [Chitinophaga pinensis]ACU61979.1 transcriptional regulator, TetR family [Chitinophaga pinensis DSM 2588]